MNVRATTSGDGTWVVDFEVGGRRIDVRPVSGASGPYTVTLRGTDGREVASKRPIPTVTASVETAMTWLGSWGAPPTVGERQRITAVAAALDGGSPAGGPEGAVGAMVRSGRGA